MLVSVVSGVHVPVLCVCVVLVMCGAYMVYMWCVNEISVVCIVYFYMCVVFLWCMCGMCVLYI